MYRGQNQFECSPPLATRALRTHFRAQPSAPAKAVAPICRLPLEEPINPNRPRKRRRSHREENLPLRLRLLPARRRDENGARQSSVHSTIRVGSRHRSPRSASKKMEADGARSQLREESQAPRNSGTKGSDKANRPWLYFRSKYYVGILNCREFDPLVKSQELVGSVLAVEF